MHNTDTAGLCHGNSQTMLGHRIHRRRHQRNLQMNRLCQSGGDICISWQNRRSGWFQQYIIKSKCIANFHGGAFRSSGGTGLYPKPSVFDREISENIQAK